jgi:hypothetical protein
MTTPYRHTQIGYVTLVATAVGAIGLASITVRHHHPVLWVGVVLLVLLGVLFSSLTIEVTDGELRSHFGPGFWRKHWALEDVADADVAPIRSWEGWGIRFTTRGMLYDVAGTRSIEVCLRSGRRFRLGTDEPERLLTAIRAGGVPAARA